MEKRGGEEERELGRGIGDEVRRRGVEEGRREGEEEKNRRGDNSPKCEGMYLIR